jgi:hypothetical protein
MVYFMLDLFWVWVSTNLKSVTSLPLAPRLNEISTYQLRTMTQNPQTLPFRLSFTLLEAYEDLVPPPGASLGHPVGHVVIRIKVENLSLDNIAANLTKIEIRQSNNHKILISKVLSAFDLGGLQILEQGFHLTNSNGFADWKELDAVVTYRWNDKIYTTDSVKFKVR